MLLAALFLVRVGAEPAQYWKLDITEDAKAAMSATSGLTYRLSADGISRGQWVCAVHLAVLTLQLSAAKWLWDQSLTKISECPGPCALLCLCAHDSLVRSDTSIMPMLRWCHWQYAAGSVDCIMWMLISGNMAAASALLAIFRVLAATLVDHLSEIMEVLDNEERHSARERPEVFSSILAVLRQLHEQQTAPPHPTWCGLLDAHNLSGLTPLAHCFYLEHPAGYMSALVRAGADPGAASFLPPQRQAGKAGATPPTSTPLEMAAEAGRLDWVTLLATGARCRPRDTSRHDYILSCILSGTTPSRATLRAVLQQLAALGFSLLTREARHGYTLLMRACKHGTAAAVGALLDTIHDLALGVQPAMASQVPQAQPLPQFPAMLLWALGAHPDAI